MSRLSGSRTDPSFPRFLSRTTSSRWRGISADYDKPDSAYNIRFLSIEYEAHFHLLSSIIVRFFVRLTKEPAIASYHVDVKAQP